MRKLIFLDIDGTIAAPGQPPGKDTVAAIRAARANGHKVFLSTGRLESSIPENILSIGFDGGIYSAGGRVVVGGKELFNRSMPAELIEQVTGLMKEWALYFWLESATGMYAGIDDRSLPYVSGDTIRFLEIELNALPRERMPGHDAVYKIVFLAQSISQAEQLRQTLSSSAKVVHFGPMGPDMPVFGEISDWNIHKGAALGCVCRYLEAEPKDCVAFGDSLNDMEMLQAAGIGIAMGNAEKRLKELADQVCERCDQDGVAKALARLGLI